VEGGVAANLNKKSELSLSENATAPVVWDGRGTTKGGKMSYYSKQHYRLVCPKKDTQKDILDRKLVRTAQKLSAKDTAKKYPTLDVSKVGEILAYQQARFDSHIKRLRTKAGL